MPPRRQFVSVAQMTVLLRYDHERGSWKRPAHRAGGLHWQVQYRSRPLPAGLSP